MILNGHSYYSLRYGTLSINELIDIAKAKHYDSIALTDINNTSGVLHFVKACYDKSIKPIVGAEFKIGNDLLFVAIARNNEGFKEINELLTLSNLSGVPYPDKPVFENCYVIYPYGKPLFPLKDHEYNGVKLSDLNKIVLEKKNCTKKVCDFAKLYL